ncbi:5869_t:CDS:2 [Ambispora gerdemannii]|uniref:5869_t:CDS:1 n=1 Tax=Ambispora gerdemannii TaxID=144530 RepID=A0A9N8VYR9_9GLOM|nr:5869_t:CDS:2 [Ambispora gerdemannii]
MSKQSSPSSPSSPENSNNMFEDTEETRFQLNEPEEWMPENRVLKMDKENLELQQTLTKELNNRPSAIISRRDSTEDPNMNSATEDMEIEASIATTMHPTVSQPSRKSDDLQESNTIEVIDANSLDNMILDAISSPLDADPVNLTPSDTIQAVSSLTEVTLTNSNSITFVMKTKATSDAVHEINDTDDVNLITNSKVANDAKLTEENSSTAVIDTASLEIKKISASEGSSSSTNDNIKYNNLVVSGFFGVEKASKVSYEPSAGKIETTSLEFPTSKEVSSLEENVFEENQNPTIVDDGCDASNNDITTIAGIKRKSKNNNVNNDPSFKKESANHFENTYQENTKTTDSGGVIVLSNKPKVNKNSSSTAIKGTTSLETDTSSRELPTEEESSSVNLNASDFDNNGVVTRSKAKFKDKTSSTMSNDTTTNASSSTSSNKYKNNLDDDVNTTKTRLKVKPRDNASKVESRNNSSATLIASKSQKNNTATSSQRGQKRKHEDYSISVEETTLTSHSNIDAADSNRYEMRRKKKKARNVQNIQISDEMKVKLIDDWEWITTQYQLVPLPKSKTVENILDDFYQYKKNFDSRGLNSGHQKDDDPLWQDLEGLKAYFNEALGARLLYRAERTQLYEFREKNAEVECAAYYGAEHLLRLLVALPGIVDSINIREEKAVDLCGELISFLESRTEMYFAKVYENASPMYIRLSEVF